MGSRRLALVGLGLLLVGVAGARAEDWPQWRGPRGDGISTEKIADAWPATGPRHVWSAKVGNGYASPIGVQGIVYLFMATGGHENLMAFDAATGKELWRKGYEATDVKDGGYKGTRATPAFENGKIYTFGAGGAAVCWNAADGAILWRTDVLQELHAGSITWGCASNPLFIGKRMFVQGGTEGPVLVGLDKATGKITWRSEAKGLSGYAHPILIAVGGQQQIVVLGGNRAYGMAVETGKTLWSYEWTTQYDVNASTPLYRDGHLLLTSGYGHGSVMLQISAAGAKVAWESKDIQSRFQPLVLDGDFVYVCSEGHLKCLHWPESAVLWQEDLKLNEGGSLVRLGDKLLVQSQRGKVYLLKTDGKAPQKLAEAKIFDANYGWSTPLIYQGRLYAKGGEELICLDISGK